LESSTLVAERVPLLAEAAAMVGDLQVRNRGTIGGSIAHADPAADLPAVMLACEARFHTVGGTRHRTIRAERMFVDAYTTALGETEILTLIEVPVTRARTGCSYQKLANKASRFAVVGVAVLVTLDADGGCERVRIGVTGAGPAASRARAAERSLTARTPTSENVATAAKRASRGIECLSDVHGSAEYREHLVGELTRRALTEAAARAARA
jgi:carbon-monoxide dehydrogenase medium subunit